MLIPFNLLIQVLSQLFLLPFFKDVIILLEFTLILKGLTLS